MLSLTGLRCFHMLTRIPKSEGGMRGKTRDSKNKVGELVTFITSNASGSSLDCIQLLFTISFDCDSTILLTLGRVYGGQKINGQNIYYLNPHMGF